MTRKQAERLLERAVREAYYTLIEDDMAAVLMYEADCPVCGKRFRHSGSSWTYKRRTGSTSAIYFCSWTCVRAYDANDGRKAKKDGQEMETLRDGVEA